MGNIGALAVAVVYGWATPYAGGTTPHDRLGFTIWIVLCGCLFGLLTSVPLIAHMLRSPTLSARDATWLLLRRSWVGIVLYSVVGPATVYLLLCAGIPLVHYNAHSAITTLIATVGSTGIVTNAIAIHRRRHLEASAAASSATAVHPASVALRHKAPPPHSPQPPRPPSWTRTLRKASALMLPSAVSVVLATQYVMFARRIQFTTSTELLLFCMGSTVLKTVLPIVSKMYMARNRIRNARSSLFMLVAPIMHVEIQMRMAVMRAYHKSTPIYVSSAIMNVLEILMRVATVAVDIALVHRAKRRKDRDQQAAIDASGEIDQGGTDIITTGQGNEAMRSIALAARLQELETEFAKWKREHMRNCSNEILAERAAEYCSIGVVTLYMIVLHGNRSLDLPVSTAASLGELVLPQLVALATQVAFEIVTDVVSIFIELRAGIPLLDTLQHDHERFLRWVIPVVVIHACGLCLSSLVVFE